MTAWSRRRSSRRLGSKSIISGLATGLGSFGAFAIGVTLVVPDLAPGPLQETPPGYAVSNNETTGSGDAGSEGHQAQPTDPIDQKNRDDTGSLPPRADHESIPDVGAESGGMDGLPDNEALDQAENDSGLNMLGQQGQDGGLDDTAGGDRSGSGYQRRMSGFNAPSSGAFSSAGDGSFSGDALSILSFEDGGSGGSGQDPVADPGSNISDFETPFESGPTVPETETPDQVAGVLPTSAPSTGQNIDPEGESEFPPTARSATLPTGNGSDGGQQPSMSLDQSQLQSNGQVAHEVPEPGALGLMTAALLSLWKMRRFRRVR